MSKIYVLASIPGAGKTTTALLLHRHFREQGLRVACLQQNKGQSDVHAYLSAGCRHYTIPLEAAKGREDFEQWVPSGYDVYLFEVTWPYAPIGAAYVDVFDRINETVPYEAMNDWKGYVAAFQKKKVEPPTPGASSRPDGTLGHGQGSNRAADRHEGAGRGGGPVRRYVAFDPSS